MFETITNQIMTLDSASLPEERKATLNQLIDYLKQKIKTKTAIRLNFICTHSSRPSHLAQI